MASGVARGNVDNVDWHASPGDGGRDVDRRRRAGSGDRGGVGPAGGGSSAPTGCNGDARLCGDRSTRWCSPGRTTRCPPRTAPGWMFAAQERDVGAQLHDGVRAFLIDVFTPASRSPAASRPSCGGEAPASCARWKQAVGKEGLAGRRCASASGWSDRPTGRARSTSVTGSASWARSRSSPGCARCATFLMANPREVVILVIEDYVPPDGDRGGVRRERPRRSGLPRRAPPALADAAGDGATRVSGW